ncbi:SIS domain-containing protein [Facklamia sp. DSM 111018]|uniref:SIS domain-containing protein n=1 Tax=Facklamia lactis TaxID=2749967 RepID=A0ABS0LQZ7_9LACT|nr:SIS domain-containing protein [Facklamia lactis]MBG9979545.1 SIS domain-containing protein [Facklamia lactis]MBG9985786.1 SIS domain-containing protein [Facklamia lactis]
MSIVENYFKYVHTILDKTLEPQVESIEMAANLIAESILKGKSFYVFGSGHSHMIAEELYLRAGGLAYVNAILPPELMLHEMANKSTAIERLEGYAKELLKLYDFASGDVILIVSNSGRNAVPVEMALEAQNLGGKVIAMTSLLHSQAYESRHPSQKRLFEIADVVLDNGSPIGDSGFYLPNFETPMGASSDAVGIILAQAIMCQAVHLLVEQGHVPPVFKSSNVDGADEYNQQIFDQYYRYPKH